MAEKMLIDASHPEETRVVVVRGTRIEEFDFESEHKKQIRGNIYLAKVTRVEPSLQAAFVDYGGNRHGFLAFSEIHPDYYQIPLADRQALLQAEAEDAENDPDFESADEAESDSSKPKSRSRSKAKPAEDDGGDEDGKTSKSRPRRSRRGKKTGDSAKAEDTDTVAAADGEETGDDTASNEDDVKAADAAPSEGLASAADATGNETTASTGSNDEDDGKPTEMAADVEADEISEPAPRRKRKTKEDDAANSDDESVESVGSEDAMEEVPTRSQRKPRKQYRIQEVIKRRQILLVQVVKEERGNKGAALTTYLSLAGRYSVLMPNTARGGGISRKITNLPDRKRLKEIARELEVPKGMGVILRTAGANRTKVEVKRDFEYLMRLWENVRNLTLKSTAPSLVYEEGSLIKRSIRDLYNKDISEIVVSGEEGYREAKDFMKMLMPSHAKVVQPYRDLHPIFARSGIEAQLDRMLQPQVTLKSGGYIIINQTEALVAIDVNSGRSTREHSIEDTAVQTNLEAAEEVARQLRLRDLAGLIVIDFIDMEENRNNRAVEKRMKDCLKNDRARIQVGRISHFGLLEMSRQRIRASVLESTMQICPTCGGNGHIRSQSSVALHVLRGVEEHLLKNTTHDIIVRTTAETALYMLNHKRDTVVDLEKRFGVSISFSADETVGANHFAIDRGAAVESPVDIQHITVNSPAYPEDDDDPEIVEETDDESTETEETSEAQSDDRPEREDGQGKKRRRRRRRGGRKPEGDNGNGDDQAASSDNGSDQDENGDDGNAVTSSDEEGTDSSSDGENDDQPRGKRRRRGKRGGRRNREEDANGSSESADETAQQGDVAASANEASAPTEVASEPSEAAPAAMEAEAAPADAATAAEEQPVKPARKKRRTKAQIAADKAAEEEAAAAATEADANSSNEANVAAEATAPVVAEAEEKNEETAADRSARTDLAAIATAPVVTSSNGTDEVKKPKKAGWWQKRGFF